MQESRRVFLGMAVGLATTAALEAAQRTMRPVPGQFDPPFGRRRNMQAVLKSNQEKIKKDFAELSKRVEELGKELDDNDAVEVLSVDVIRQAEQIEDLAKQIEKLAKNIRQLVRG